MSTGKPPPAHTLDAYLVGALSTWARAYPRVSVKRAFKEALISAHKRGYEIPKHLEKLT